MLSYLPLSHVAERTLVEHGCWRTGMHVFFAESLDTFTADLQRARPTVFFSVPRLWVKFQQGITTRCRRPSSTAAEDPHPRRHRAQEGPDRAGPGPVRVAAGGAAPMPPELLRWYGKLGLDLVEVYGMTENCGVSHATCPASSGRAPSACPTTACRAASTRPPARSR
jgi:long-chain acyl-CoA synthetase